MSCELLFKRLICKRVDIDQVILLDDRKKRDNKFKYEEEYKCTIDSIV